MEDLNSYFASCKGIRIPQSGLFLLVEYGIWENFACCIRKPGLCNTEYSLRNPESQAITTGILSLSSTDKDWNPVLRIRNPRHWIQGHSEGVGIACQDVKCRFRLIRIFYYWGPLESLNWVNRQPSKGLKINRLPSKRGSFFTVNRQKSRFKLTVKNLKVFHISMTLLLQLIFTKLWLLKNF